MILDLLENLDRYKSVVPFTDKISLYLKGNDINILPEGKYQIEGESIFILIQKYDSQPESEREGESHRKYIDIQFVLNGEEYIAYFRSSILRSEIRIMLKKI